mgnify:CR=1 FL=1
MSRIKLVDLVGITPRSIDRYLHLLGWRRDDAFGNRKLWKYVDYQNPEVQLLVPASDRYPDYYLRVDNVLTFLSEILEKQKSEILIELKATYSDYLEFRIASPFADAGKLPLDYASECIEGIKNLILYSACAVQDAKPICIKASGSARKTLNKFELGQTGVGSFIINIDAKVSDEEDDHIVRLADTDQSIEHKVVERISTAMQQVEDVTNGARITDIAADAFKKGITANMCESLLRLKPDGEIHVELETTIRYASSVTEKIGVSKVAKFKDIHFAVLKEIASIYRDKTIVEDMTLIGTISKMQLHNQEERTIAIECKIDEGTGSRQVQAGLTEEQHRLACDAYKANLCVKISGVVDKSKKIWTISDILDFEILPPVR